MTDQFEFTSKERERALTLYSELKEKITGSLEPGDEEKLRLHLHNIIEKNQVKRDLFGLNPIVSSLQTALLVVDEIGLRRDAVVAIMLNPSVEAGLLTIDEATTNYGISVG
ncbi:MAG: RelA/SpoT family protein, partial [Prevotella sp.]|nr:RelA/SpoT family protein [Prevotella sp.]